MVRKRARPTAVDATVPVSGRESQDMKVKAAVMQAIDTKDMREGEPSSNGSGEPHDEAEVEEEEEEEIEQMNVSSSSAEDDGASEDDDGEEADSNDEGGDDGGELLSLVCHL